MLSLAVEKRTLKGANTSVLRRTGLIPAVVYGAHHEATSIAIPEIAFGKVLKEAGEATIVSLTGIGTALPTLIHEVAYDPVSNKPLHVDFYAVTKGEKVEVAIPFDFVGESEAVKAGANLLKVLHEIEVEADPMNLPHSISVDLSLLKVIDDRIMVKDLMLPDGVTIKLDPEDVIVLVQAVVEEKEEIAPADIASIEVEKKGKEEGAAEDAPAEENK